MIKLLVVMLVILSSIAFAKDDISIPFTEENARYWQYISDQTMGGISNGQAILEQDEGIYFARLTGNVKTENNGGFIQLRSTLSFMNLGKQINKIKGLRLHVRGNGEIYHIFIRNRKTKSYSDYYSATFKTTNEWGIVKLPFSQFKNRFSNKILEGNDIGTLGIVAYGREFFSDVSVSEIIFYF